MGRITAAVASLSAIFSAAASAQVQLASVTTPVIPVPPAPIRIDAPPADPEAALAEALVLALGDAGHRMTVPVRVAGRGPWGFIIDTGSERTVIGRELARVLRLAPGPTVRVTAMTGAANTGTVRVPHLSVSEADGIAASPVEAPVFATRDIGAAGLLGVDALQKHRVVIDFDRATMSVAPSRKRASGTSYGDDIVVTAKSLFGQLIVTDAQFGSKRVSLVIDTGSPISVGNPALLKALGARPRFAGQVQAVSVTGDVLTAQAFLVNGVKIGGITLNNVPVAVADAAPFHRFKLTERPAILIGMDVLRLFRTVQIDFPNRQIRFRMPRGVQHTEAF
jgi:predicted aspartyl protease